MAVVFPAPVGGAKELLRAHARREIATRAAQRHDAHPGVEIGALEDLEQRLDHESVDRVFLLGTIEGRGEDACVHRGEHAVGHRGTSTSIRKRAVGNTLPCASGLRATVPPPSSAPCKRKFKAYKLGSS